MGIELGEERDYGVGMFFFPQDELAEKSGKEDVRDHCRERRNEFLGWREVPTFPNVLGKKQLDCMP